MGTSLGPLIWVGRNASIKLGPESDTPEVSPIGTPPAVWEMAPEPSSQEELTVSSLLSTRHFLVRYDSFAWLSALARRFFPLKQVFLCLVKAPALSNDRSQRQICEYLVVIIAGFQWVSCSQGHRGSSLMELVTVASSYVTCD